MDEPLPHLETFCFTILRQILIALCVPEPLHHTSCIVCWQMIHYQEECRAGEGNSYITLQHRHSTTKEYHLKAEVLDAGFGYIHAHVCIYFIKDISLCLHFYSSFVSYGQALVQSGSNKKLSCCIIKKIPTNFDGCI